MWQSYRSWLTSRFAFKKIRCGHLCNGHLNSLGSFSWCSGLVTYTTVLLSFGWDRNLVIVVVVVVAAAAAVGS
jgi:hypothetical protein